MQENSQNLQGQTAVTVSVRFSNSTRSYPTLTARPMLIRQGHHVMFMC
jgi:hypothetical protein